MERIRDTLPEEVNGYIFHHKLYAWKSREDKNNINCNEF